MTLFPDSETFIKERPKGLTQQQKDELLRGIAEEAVKYNYVDDDLDAIIEDLEEFYPFDGDAFDMAVDLRDRGYEADSAFVEWLESLSMDYRKALDNNVRMWVAAHDVKPKFRVGDQLGVHERLNYKIPSGDVVFVNGVQEDLGRYLIHQERKNGAGYVIDFEVVEKNCEQ